LARISTFATPGPDRKELAKLLGADDGFEVTRVQDLNGEVRFVLVRETEVDGMSLDAARERQRDAERRSFL
jgi:hypothetical protein